MNGSRDRLPSAIARLWQTVQGAGLERFEFVGQGKLWILKGTILHLHDSTPVEARYLIECDLGWRTANARIEVHDHRQERTLEIKTEGGYWTATGDPQPQLDGSWTGPASAGGAYVVPMSPAPYRGTTAPTTMITPAKRGQIIVD